MKINDSMTRRKLLESTRNGLLLAPLLRVFKMDEGLGADAILPRAIFIHWPCGVYGDTWFPGGETGALGALPQVSSPLEAFKNDLVMFKGVCLRGDANHDGGPYQVLAGWGMGGGTHYGVDAPDAKPYSLDQRLADKWGAKTSRPSILLGATTSVPALRNAISFKADGAPVPLQDNPKAAFNDIFGGFSLTGVPMSSSSLALAQDKVLTGKKRLVDFLVGDIKKIKGQLGPTEGAAFEAHLGALDEIQKEIQKQEELTGGGGGGGGGGGTGTNPPTDGRPPKLAACNPNELKNQLPGESGTWYHQINMLPTVYKLNRQIMMQAMACGITRVGVLSFGISDTTVDFGGGAYHTLSHGGGANYTNVQKTFMTEVAELVKALQGVKSGDRTLWDEVLMLGSTDNGDNPNAHDNTNIGCFMAGRLGGKFKGNRLISTPFASREWGNKTNGLAYNKLLHSFSHLVGEPMDNIGNAANSGTVGGLV